MSDVVVIDRRYASWEGTAHGGYVAGLAASRVGPNCEVSLRSAAPFDRDLSVEHGPDGQVELRDGPTVVVRGAPADVRIDVPALVPYEEAASHVWDLDKLNDHPTPYCFCCGHEREEGDGLRVFPAPIKGRSLGHVAAPWVPHPTFANGDGSLRTEFVWTALDCPGFWGMALFLGHMPNVITIRLASFIEGPVRAGERHVVLGWPIEHRGRKYVCGSAIYGPSGDLLAAGRATWLAVRDVPTG
ncbi:MAG TPA: hypothetical protein VKA30_00545 [Actinomycetota bacterium]|nr:hypothetical protein [Actinomycetota bacterium]